MSSGNNPQKAQERDWYSISVVSLRRGMLLLGLVLALIGGSFVYQQWEHATRRDRAEQIIAEATDLARELEDRDDFGQIRLEHHGAWEDLEGARKELAAERYAAALDRGRRSLRELARVSQTGESDTAGKYRFLSIQGGVEYRRGERGSWKKARVQDILNPGDWVKTSADGSTEVSSSDGSKFTLRRSTMVHLGASSGGASGRGEPVTDIAFGWVELNTAQSSSKVTTPKSEAEVHEDSEAVVTFDQDRSEARFAAYEGGGLEVRSANGQTQTVSALQQVDQVGDLLSKPKPLPGRPQLLSPANNQEIDFDSGKELQLAWRPVPSARRYVLNVSRSQLFATNIIETDNRYKTTARIGIRGEGIFHWQVAAIDREGTRGPWSEPRTFRVASLRGVTDTDDKTPPELRIEEVQTYGSLVLVNGSTEPGATVTINREPVSVQLDGSFSKTIQMSQNGFAFVEIVATDAWGNPNALKRRVFIDAF